MWNHRQNQNRVIRPHTNILAWGFTQPFQCRVKQSTEKAEFTPHQDSGAGFTLLELMLVAVIMLVLVTISTPLFKRTYEDLRLTSSAKEIASVMRFCRERAIFERKTFILNIDTEKKTYQVFAEDEDNEEPLPLKSRWGRIFRIPDGIDVEVDVKEIDFFPDGSTTPVSIYLTNKEGKAFTILIERDTGFVRVYDYKKIPRSLSSE